MRSSAGQRAALETSPIEDQDRARLADVLLAGYRDTIDDEGEDVDDALAAIDHYLATALRSHSHVLFDTGEVIGFAFVVLVDDVHYIDPVVVTPRAKGHGVGGALVAACLASLAAAGVTTVGATITDGNTPSERLFARLGFERVGAWPPA